MRVKGCSSSREHPLKHAHPYISYNNNPSSINQCMLILLVWFKTMWVEAKKPKGAHEAKGVHRNMSTLQPPVYAPFKGVSPFKGGGPMGGWIGSVADSLLGCHSLMRMPSGRNSCFDLKRCSSSSQLTPVVVPCQAIFVAHLVRQKSGTSAKKKRPADASLLV